jgi:hypothetical protein
MRVQETISITATAAVAQRATAFADPEWRGGGDDGWDTGTLRPTALISAQMQRLASWIARGSDYGWLGAYQARRAAFELQSIRAQMEHAAAQNFGDLPDNDRWAVQSRLDRLELCLEAVRSGEGLG